MTLARHALITIVLLLLASAPAAAQEPAGPGAILAFYPGTPAGGTGVLEKLQARPQLSVGLLGATQGPYSVRQALLDISQGHRLSRSGYEPQELPGMRLEGGVVRGFDEAVRRAGTAPADIRPGLLGESVPGGPGYVGISGTTNVEAIVAADRTGRVAEVELVPGAEVAGRARAMLERRPLVVVALPTGADGERGLDRLVAARRPNELLMVIRTPPRSRASQQLPIATLGLGEDGRPGLLRSPTTRHDGLVAGHDVLPTLLEHLGLPIPGPVRGRGMFVTYDREGDASYLRDFERRLRVVSPRRNPTLLGIFGAALLVALLGLVRRRRRRIAWRIAGLSLLYVPLVALVVAALTPSARMEVVLTALGPVALAALTDRLVPWPRAPAIPALGGVAAYVVDLAFGSPLIVRSLLGPNPRFGARWYGIGNELEAALPVMLLVGLAAAAGAAARSYRLAGLFGGAMLLLGAIVGAGRLGADVGGVITIGAGGAAAVLLTLPGRLTRRRILLACAAPVVAVVLLAVVDVVTGGDSHFTATVLGADDTGALADVVDRRTTLAWNAFWRGLMPLFTALSVVLVVVAWRRRSTLYAPVADRPAWPAALAGSAVGGIVGSLANDSGPILLVISVVLLLGATSYVSGVARSDNKAGQEAA